MPKIIINNSSDSEDEELNISHTPSEHSLKRSSVGRKMNNDEEVNTSLRELKENRLSIKLSPVIDEINRNRLVSPSISTVHSPTERSARAYGMAQARLLDINKKKADNNKFKSPTNILRKRNGSSKCATPSPNLVQQQSAVERTAKFINVPQQDDPNEGAGTNSQTSSSGNSSKGGPNSIQNGSSRNKENKSDPLTPRKIFGSRENISSDDEQPSRSERLRRHIMLSPN